MDFKTQLSYQTVKVLPPSDTDWRTYESFKKMFGEDVSVMVIGFNDPDFFRLGKFNDWYQLNQEIKKIQGIKNCISITSLYQVSLNDSLNKFDFLPLVTKPPRSQEELDQIKKLISSLPFYEGFIYDKKKENTLMAVSFTDADLHTKHRIETVQKIKRQAELFGIKYHLQMHYSGMPYIRTELMAKVGSEMGLFMVLVLIVTIIILWLFFHSFSSVFFSILVVLIGVVWSLGTMQLLGYQVTILSGLIPPLIMVIGVPNCIFLINKYHSEFSKHRNKIKALSRMIETIGVSLFLANITTAIGFGVLYFTDSSLLVEFGVVAAINVMITYLITLILIPIILSYLPSPSVKHTKHLEAKRINGILKLIDHLVHDRRKAIYVTITLITLISLYGMKKINVIGFVVDDLPQKDPIYSDLKYFEEKFNGVLPLEVLVDTKKPNGIFADNAAALYKIKSLQKMLGGYPEFSKPMSIVEGIKFSYQAYKGGNPKYFILPGISELQKLNQYTTGTKEKENSLQKFIDSTKQRTRISIQMADVGSKRIKEMMTEIRPRVDSIFDPKKYSVSLTGHSLVFLKGNDYLLKNLFESLLIEIILITLVGFALFRSFRIILLSKLPCLIPLIITAGIMGYLGIRFKPSTILIFSIAFGISSDGTIYFLTRYRQELKKHQRSVSEAISITIKETGLSMIYTAVILFCGFAVFAASSFGGTIALGVLISITLLVAMCTNLILLPALLLSINNWISRKEILEEPLIEIEEEQ
jgi:predicted RND superfamily exporter protein